MPSSTELAISGMTETGAPSPSNLTEVGSTFMSQRVPLSGLGYGWWNYNASDLFSTGQSYAGGGDGKVQFVVIPNGSDTAFSQANFVLPPGLSTGGATFKVRLHYSFNANGPSGSTEEVVAAVKVNMWATGNNVMAASTTTNGTATMNLPGPSTANASLYRVVESTDIVTSAAGEVFGSLAVFRHGTTAADTYTSGLRLFHAELIASL